MKQNKFWLVCRNIDFDETLNTKEEAIQKARHACEVNFENNVYILEATHHFKTDVTEADLTAPENDFVELAEPATDEPKHKFKIGDKVLINGINGNYKIDKILADNYFVVKNGLNGRDFLDYKVEAKNLTLAEPTIDETSPVEPNFKVGDRVVNCHGGFGVVLEVDSLQPQNANVRFDKSGQIYWWDCRNLTLEDEYLKLTE